MLCALLFLGLAAFYVFLAVPRYTATASLILKSEQQNLVGFESVLPELSSDMQSMNTELLILESDSLLGDVVDSLSLQQDPEFNPWLRPEPAWKEKTGYNALWEKLGFPPSPLPRPDKVREKVIDNLNRKVETYLVPQTFAIKVSVETTDPEKSAEIVNTIARVYIDNQLQNKFTRMDDAMVWLGRRVAELEEDLENAENQYRSFNVSTVAPTGELMLLQTEKLKRLREDLIGKRKEAADIRDRMDRLQALYDTGNYRALSEFTRDPRLQALAADLAADPSDSLLLSRFESMFQNQIQELEGSAGRLDRQIQSLEIGVNEFEDQLREISSEFIRRQQLEREAEATRLIYEHTLARMKEVSIQQGIQASDARVLDPAQVPDFASHPRTVLSLGAGAFLGLIFGLGFVFTRNAMSTTFQTSEELENAARVPVIGLVPHARVKRSQNVLRHMVENPASPVAESIRNLRTTIHLSNIDAPPQVVMLTSTVPGEGKSTISAAIGQTSAQSGRRVLLIDADLRRRAQKENFGVGERAGLLAVLSGATSFDEAVWHDDTSHLDVLIADEGTVTAGDIFGSARFDSFLSEVRRIYDLVLIDTPPILAVSDTRVVAQHADAVVYVVRWNATERKAVQAGLNALAQVNVPVAGAVLNGVKAKGSDSYGYYGYSYT